MDNFDLPQNNPVLSKITDRQRNIYFGLKSIGEEISGFYLDGLRIYFDDRFMVQSYLLAHAAREIDGGLRDILVVGEEKETEKCISCGRTIDQDKMSHQEAISIAVNKEKNDDFVEKWFTVAKNFAKIAHRHGSWREPRDSSEIKRLWDEYENILFYLVGNFINLQNVIDRLLLYEKPNEGILGTLNNAFKDPIKYRYFFDNLRSPHWLADLKKMDYFNPINHPEPLLADDEKGFYAPKWPVMEYFKNISDNHFVNENKNLRAAFKSTLNEIIEYRIKYDVPVKFWNTDWNIFQILEKIPIDLLDDLHYDFIRVSITGDRSISSHLVENFFERLVKEESINNIVKLLEVIFSYRFVDKRTYPSQFKSIMDEYGLINLMKKYNKIIYKLLGLKSIEIPVGKVEEIIIKDNKEYSNTSISTIENSSQILNPSEYIIQIVHFIRDYLEQENPEIIMDIINVFLNHKYVIFQRIAIHTINYHYDKLNSLFWDVSFNPFDDYKLKHELFELVNNNCTKFSDNQITQILSWIDTMKVDIQEDNPDILEQFKVGEQKEMLKSLSKLDNKEVDILYKKYDKIYPRQIEHPGYLSFISDMSWSGYESPLTIEEIYQMSNHELCTYLIEFKGGDYWRGPNIFGLQNVLQQCVKKYPDKFITDIIHFQSVKYYYISSILRGVTESFTNLKNSNFQDVITFISSMINRHEFWINYEIDIHERNSQKTHYESRGSIEFLNDSSDFIKEGLKNKNKIYPDDLLAQIEELLILLDTSTKSDLWENHNVLDATLNSSKGRILYTIFEYLLYFADVRTKHLNVKWSYDIKAHFEKVLDKKLPRTIEHSVVFGINFQNIYYFDAEWARKNINKIFPKNDKLNWQASMSGFLYWRRPIKDIYDILKKNSHLKMAIDTLDLSVGSNTNYIDHIVISTIWKWEKVSDDDSLINYLIIHGNATHLIKIVEFVFWLQHYHNWQIDNSIIKELWHTIYNRIIQEEEKEYKDIIMSFCKWILIIDTLDDEIYELIQESISALINGFDMYNLTKGLTKFLKDEPQKVGNLLLLSIHDNLKFVPHEENIIEIVEYLYLKNISELANDICNRFSSKGNHFLNGIYNKYNLT